METSLYTPYTWMKVTDAWIKETEEWLSKLSKNHKNGNKTANRR